MLHAMPCTASTLGSLSILLLLLLLFVVWLLRVVPVRKLQLHVCYPAGLGAGMERAEKKVGDLAGEKGGGCIQLTDLSLLL